MKSILDVKYFWQILGVIFVLLISFNAFATTPKKPPPAPPSQTQQQDAEGGDAYARGGDGGKGGHAYGAGGDGGKGYGEGGSVGDTTSTSEGTGTAHNEGNNNLTENDTTFFAFNTSLPNAGECFGAVQGGGAGDGGGGFFGIRPLNNDCWYDRIAEAEESVGVRARLKCGSRMFRNAIAYNVKKKSDRQGTCIAYMMAVYTEQVKQERATLTAALAKQTAFINSHTTTETERTSAQTTRAVEKCTNCFGEK